MATVAHAIQQSVEEFERLREETTRVELARLQEFIKENATVIDDTRYFRSRFLCFKQIRFDINYWTFSLLSFYLPLLGSSLKDYKQSTLHQQVAFFILYSLFLIHLCLTLFCVWYNVWFLTAYELFAPIALYMLFSFVYSTQQSV